ncbi:unnamed protein product [Rotaria socialis]|uniref:Rab-like protein 3 n=1 Tax=Rotaria socialis TaxID=392032 RepID=A0A818H9J9_9BILA|nr:unnamed protein product [Rotaria socialis]CAF3317830.1 unnamed protein product [Rotaria socialis]CAF3369864.1 unnamed protein product [Rotaria socialis]CAF3438925.1 unnamed protein product [Rotaria socialis]CAF3504442.1 unnamed protein product [Rotaria socialis]
MGTNGDIPTLVVLVLGDSSVGKTSFVHMVCHDQPLSTPPPVTVGCHIEIKLYERRDRHHNPNLYFIEFHDVGGSVQHKNSRSSMFYDEFNGIILVSDLTSHQSYDNLKEWLYEVIRYRSRQKLPTEFTPDVLQNFDIPILLVHTKLDESNGVSLLDNSKSPNVMNNNHTSSSSSLLPNFNRKSVLANLFNCDEIFINCYSNKRFSVDTPNVTKLNSFFEKMIKKASVEPVEQLPQFEWFTSENHYIH